jgi:hypothetical protein
MVSKKESAAHQSIPGKREWSLVRYKLIRALSMQDCALASNSFLSGGRLVAGQNLGR